MSKLLTIGPIIAGVFREAPQHPALRVVVGDFELIIQATPKGRRVFVTIDDGAADVQVARRRKDGTWT